MIAGKQVEYLGVINRLRRAEIKRMEHDLSSFQTIDVGANRLPLSGRRPESRADPGDAQLLFARETTLSWRQLAQFEKVSDLIKLKFFEMGYIDNTKTVSQRVGGDAWSPQRLSLFKQTDFERTKLIVRPVGQDAYGCR